MRRRVGPLLLSKSWRSPSGSWSGCASQACMAASGPGVGRRMAPRSSRTCGKHRCNTALQRLLLHGCLCVACAALTAARVQIQQLEAEKADLQRRCAKLQADKERLLGMVSRLELEKHHLETTSGIPGLRRTARTPETVGSSNGCGSTSICGVLIGLPSVRPCSRAAPNLITGSCSLCGTA